MTWKHPDDMTLEEARSEMHHLEGYFRSCAEIGQGINSKETIRHRLCKFKVDYHDTLGRTMEPGEDIAKFMRQGHLMFAPVDCPCYICRAYEKEQAEKKQAETST
jgi:hypothetical protein